MSSYYYLATSLIAFGCFLVGMALGWGVREWHEMQSQINRILNKARTESEAPVRTGIITPNQEAKPTTRVVTPKTPQRIEWEEENKRRDEALNHNVPIGPK